MRCDRRCARASREQQSRSRDSEGGFTVLETTRIADARHPLWSCDDTGPCRSGQFPPGPRRAHRSSSVEESALEAIGAARAGATTGSRVPARLRQASAAPRRSLLHAAAAVRVAAPAIAPRRSRRGRADAGAPRRSASASRRPLRSCTSPSRRCTRSWTCAPGSLGVKRIPSTRSASGWATWRPARRWRRGEVWSARWTRRCGSGQGAVGGGQLSRRAATAQLRAGAGGGSRGPHLGFSPTGT